MSKDPYSIIKRPLVTEKGTNLLALNKYAFEVDIKANKIEIAQAIKQIFSVDAVKVNTLRVRGNRKRLGRMSEGKTPDIKKAYVTLKPGQSIGALAEGA